MDGGKIYFKYSHALKKKDFVFTLILFQNLCPHYKRAITGNFISLSFCASQSSDCCRGNLRDVSCV